MSLIQLFIDRCSNYRPRIGIVGDSMIDQYFSVHVDRISPEFPIPVMKSPSQKPDHSMPGGAANVCYQFKHLNAKAHLISLLNMKSVEILGEHNLSFDLCVVPKDAKVPIKQRLYHGETPFCRWDIEDDNYGLNPALLRKSQQLLFNQYKESEKPKDDILILSDYNKGVFNGFSSRAQWTSLGIPTIVDPKAHPIEGWQGCTIFKPNSEEASMLSRETDYHSQVEYFLEVVKCESVVITQGGNGVVGWDGRTKKFFEYKNTSKIPSQSVIGAGDCFAAFLAMAYVHSFTVAESAEIAFRAGTEYVQNMHNRPITTYDLVKSEDPIKAKYMTPPAGGKLVFANGCFDVIHPGHLALLRFAKSKGERLIVALNSDDSVKRLKGDRRPINKLSDRMEVIASLDCVDFVTSFNEDTPKECIDIIKPEVLVKGEDYTIEQIVGADVVKEVYRCPIVQGASTTNIVNRMQVKPQ